MTGFFRYSNAGTWFKGNTHTHSVLSDGVLSVEHIARIYAESGYDFIAMTDHQCVFPGSASGNGMPLHILGGVELDGWDEKGRYYHVVALGQLQGLDRDMSRLAEDTQGRILPGLLRDIQTQNGFLIWAHPHWSGNTMEDGLRFNFEAMEVFNAGSQREVGRGLAGPYWDYLLKRNPEILGIAADDAHFSAKNPFWKEGWIMVNARELSHDGLLTALRRGNYYSTTGPDFKLIALDGDHVFVETSPCRIIRMISPQKSGACVFQSSGQGVVTTAAFRIPDEDIPIRLEIEDFQGRCAWSNPLFTSSWSGQDL